jgi:MEMO1 family protein
MNQVVQKAQVAGMFYPADPQELSSLVESLLGQCHEKPSPSTVQALIAPHAGYIYSGATAAEAYIKISEAYYDRVLVLGPMHRQYLAGVSVFAQGFFETPLGKIEVDEVFASKLIQPDLGVQFHPPAYLLEHSIEVHLPFLQVALSAPFKLVPILIGDLSSEQLDAFAVVLRSALDCDGLKTLVVASTDFSHFQSDVAARKLDQEGKSHILNADPEGLWSANHGNKTSLCGIHPVYTLLRLFHNFQPEFLAYSNSGETTQDFSSVVGYMSFSITS